MPAAKKIALLVGPIALLLATAAMAAALYVESPTPVLIKRGQTAPLLITVIRKDYNGPVSITLEDLPRGVTLDDANATINGSTKRYTLRAAVDAELVANRVITLTAKGGDLIASTTFKLTVRMKD